MDPMDFRIVSEAPRVMPSVSGEGGSGYRLQDRATDTNVSGIWKNVLMVIHKYYLVMLRIQINTLVMQVLKIPCFLKGQGNIFCGFFLNKNWIEMIRKICKLVHVNEGAHEIYKN